MVHSKEPVCNVGNVVWSLGWEEPLVVSSPPVLYFHGFLCSTGVFACLHLTLICYRDCLDQDGQALVSPSGAVATPRFALLGWNSFRLIWNQFMFWFDGLLLFACFSCFPGHKGSLLFFFPERLSLPSLFPVWWMCGLWCWRLFGFSLWIKLISLHLSHCELSPCWWQPLP